MIMIPQYVYLIDGPSTKIPVIIVQAEEANSIRLFGVRDLGGKEHVAKESDLELLGDKPPS